MTIRFAKLAKVMWFLKFAVYGIAIVVGIIIGLIMSIGLITMLGTYYG